MTALRFVFAQLVRKPLHTGLSLVLLALAVASLAFLAQAQSQFNRQLLRDVQGIDLVVGAKGSPLQLILSAVYHVDVPTGNVPLAAVDTLRANKLVSKVIPVSLGDNVQGFRIVGSTHALLEHYGAQLVQGALWQKPMQAVLGATAARETGLKVGAPFFGAHGLADVRNAGGPLHDDAESEYRVTGILAPSGTVIDRLVLTDLASVWQVHEGEITDADEQKILQAEREVTALLVRYASPLAAAVLPRQVNAEPGLMAAVPANELARLFALMGVGVDAMRIFAAVLFLTSLLALFAGLMNALEERRYDIAILRLLGASRARVASLLVLESWLLAAAAIALGLAIAAGSLWSLSQGLAAARSFPLSGFSWNAPVWFVIGLAWFVATLAAALPAWRAARMDVHAVLAQG